MEGGRNRDEDPENPGGNFSPVTFERRRCANAESVPEGENPHATDQPSEEVADQIRWLDLVSSRFQVFVVVVWRSGCHVARSGLRDPAASPFAIRTATNHGYSFVPAGSPWSHGVKSLPAESAHHIPSALGMSTSLRCSPISERKGRQRGGRDDGGGCPTTAPPSSPIYNFSAYELSTFI